MGTPVPTISIATTTEGGVTDELQRVGFSDDMGMLGGGTLTLTFDVTFDGQTPAAIAWDGRRFHRDMTLALVEKRLSAMPLCCHLYGDDARSWTWT